jgi:hypothetical protein
MTTLSENQLLELITQTIQSWALEELEANEDSPVTFEARLRETRKSFVEALTDQLETLA